MEDKLDMDMSTSPSKYSVLKPPKHRMPLKELVSVGHDEDNTASRKRRVSFANVNKIKEFSAGAESMVVCHTPAYEEPFSLSSDSSCRSGVEGWTPVKIYRSTVCKNTETHMFIEQKDNAALQNVSCRPSFLENNFPLGYNPNDQKSILNIGEDNRSSLSKYHMPSINLKDNNGVDLSSLFVSKQDEMDPTSYFSDQQETKNSTSFSIGMDLTNAVGEPVKSMSNSAEGMDLTKAAISYCCLNDKRLSLHSTVETNSCKSINLDDSSSLELTDVVNGLEFTGTSSKPCINNVDLKENVLYSVNNNKCSVNAMESVCDKRKSSSRYSVNNMDLTEVVDKAYHSTLDCKEIARETPTRYSVNAMDLTKGVINKNYTNFDTTTMDCTDIWNGLEHSVDSETNDSGMDFTKPVFEIARPLFNKECELPNVSMEFTEVINGLESRESVCTLTDTEVVETVDNKVINDTHLQKSIVTSAKPAETQGDKVNMAQMLIAQPNLNVGDTEYMLNTVINKRYEMKETHSKNVSNMINASQCVSEIGSAERPSSSIMAEDIKQSVTSFIEKENKLTTKERKHFERDDKAIETKMHNLITHQSTFVQTSTNRPLEVISNKLLSVNKKTEDSSIENMLPKQCTKQNDKSMNSSEAAVVNDHLNNENISASVRTNPKFHDLEFEQVSVLRQIDFDGGLAQKTYLAPQIDKFLTSHNDTVKDTPSAPFDEQYINKVSLNFHRDISLTNNNANDEDKINGNKVKSPHTLKQNIEKENVVNTPSKILNTTNDATITVSVTLESLNQKERDKLLSNEHSKQTSGQTGYEKPTSTEYISVVSEISLSLDSSTNESICNKNITMTRGGSRRYNTTFTVQKDSLVQKGDDSVILNTSDKNNLITFSPSIQHAAVKHKNKLDCSESNCVESSKTDTTVSSELEKGGKRSFEVALEPENDTEGSPVKHIRLLKPNCFAESDLLTNVTAPSFLMDTLIVPGETLSTISRNVSLVQDASTIKLDADINTSGNNGMEKNLTYISESRVDNERENHSSLRLETPTQYNISKMLSDQDKINHLNLDHYKDDSTLSSNYRIKTDYPSGHKKPLDSINDSVSELSLSIKSIVCSPSTEESSTNNCTDKQQISVLQKKRLCLSQDLKADSQKRSETTIDNFREFERVNLNAEGVFSYEVITKWIELQFSVNSSGNVTNTRYNIICSEKERAVGEYLMEQAKTSVLPEQAYDMLRQLQTGSMFLARLARNINLICKYFNGTLSRNTLTVELISCKQQFWTFVDINIKYPQSLSSTDISISEQRIGELKLSHVRQIFEKIEKTPDQLLHFAAALLKLQY